MKYNDYVANKTTEELQNELVGLNDAIEIAECFNSRDLILREVIEAELEKRGELV